MEIPMAQNFFSDKNNAADLNKAMLDKVIEDNRRAVDTSKTMAHDINRSVQDAAAATVSEADRLGHKATAVAHDAIEGSRTMLEKAGRGGTDLATFWMKVMQEQVTHNVEVMRHLSAAESWNDKMKIQAEFFAGSLSRMQEVFGRYMSLAGEQQTHEPTRNGNAEPRKYAA